MRTAFVTGATGFLGRHLVTALCRQGWAVTCLCLPGEDTAGLPPGTVMARGDLTDAPSLRAAMPPAPDAVFHLAADTTTWPRQAARQHRINVVGTGNLIEAARRAGAQRLIYTSSISAYGYQPGRRITESTPSNAPTRGDPYGRSKLRAEQLVKAASADGGPAGIILNPVNILGPGDRHNWSRQLILPVARGRLRAVPPGAATWAYVDDVVAAQLAAADRGRPGENYLLGGVEATFRQVADEVAAILSRPPVRRTAPAGLLRLALGAATVTSALTGRRPALTGPQYRRAVGVLRCDDGKARRELGYRGRDLHDMLAGTIDWLYREGLLGYVEVADEPRHVEQPGTGPVRAYLATIEPGAHTRYHRHREDTLYVVLAGGAYRSRQPRRQPQRTRPGRSIGAARALGMALRRALLGTVRVRAGEVFMQHHRRFPLVHRLVAAPGNKEPLRMLGVELPQPPAGPATKPAPLAGLPVEYHCASATAYRIRLTPGTSTPELCPGRPTLLVVVAGPARLAPQAEPAARGPRLLPAGALRLLPAGALRLLPAGPRFTVSSTAAPVDALLVTLPPAAS